MARPTRCRRICIEPAYDSFRPEGIPTGEKITMTVDEYEVIRLVDLKKYTHGQCAQQMGFPERPLRKYMNPHVTSLRTAWFTERY